MHEKWLGRGLAAAGMVLCIGTWSWMLNYENGVHDWAEKYIPWRRQAYANHAHVLRACYTGADEGWLCPASAVYFKHCPLEPEVVAVR